MRLLFSKRLPRLRGALHNLVDQLPEDQVDLARHWLEDPREDAARRCCRRPGQAAGAVRTRTLAVSFHAVIAHEAEKVLDRLDRPTEQHLGTRIVQLAKDPFDR